MRLAYYELLALRLGPRFAEIETVYRPGFVVPTVVPCVYNRFRRCHRLDRGARLCLSARRV